MNKIEEKATELTEVLKAELGEIELNVLTRPFTLGDAIREGAMVTEPCNEGWGDGERACALSAAVISATARGLI